MQNYLDMIKYVLNHGTSHVDRTGVGTTRVFGYQMRMDLRQGFPLLTTKKVHFRSVAEELFWFLSGSTNEHDLQKRGVTIWSEWGEAEQCAKFGRQPGDLGPIYGKQWRSFGNGVDQIRILVDGLINNPNSRRHIVSAWNPEDVPQMALPPCHTLMQFAVMEDEDVNRLHCQLYQRSADSFLGVPFNIASYALLTHMLAHVCGYEVGDFIHTFGDLHIYHNHRDQFEVQLAREPQKLPTLTLNPDLQGRGFDALLKFKFEDLTLTGYDPAPAIKAQVAV